MLPALSSGSLIGHAFPPSEPGFLHADSNQALFLVHPPSTEKEPVVFRPQPSNEPVTSNSGSDTSNTAHVTTNSCSNSKCLSSGSGETSRLGSVVDERKLRRMLSNRESARRSRLRKQEHLKNLRNQVSRFKLGNRELMNQLQLALHQTQYLRAENECFRSEAVMLRQRLWDIRQVSINFSRLGVPLRSAWPCVNNVATIDGGQLLRHSFIT